MSKSGNSTKEAQIKEIEKLALNWNDTNNIYGGDVVSFGTEGEVFLEGYFTAEKLIAIAEHAKKWDLSKLKYLPTGEYIL